MGQRQDWHAALNTLATAQKTQKAAQVAASAALTAAMVGVALNTITNQQITDIGAAQTLYTAAGAGYDTAVLNALATIRASLDIG